MWSCPCPSHYQRAQPPKTDQKQTQQSKHCWHPKQCWLRRCRLKAVLATALSAQSWPCQPHHRNFESESLEISLSMTYWLLATSELSLVMTYWLLISSEISFIVTYWLLTSSEISVIMTYGLLANFKPIPKATTKWLNQYVAPRSARLVNDMA